MNDLKSHFAPPEECPNCEQRVYWEENIDTDGLLEDGTIEISWSCDYDASGCRRTHGQDYECDYVHGPFKLQCVPTELISPEGADAWVETRIPDDERGDWSAKSYWTKIAACTRSYANYLRGANKGE